MSESHALLGRGRGSERARERESYERDGEREREREEGREGGRERAMRGTERDYSGTANIDGSCAPRANKVLERTLFECA